MIKCSHCDNESKKEMIQHDRSKIGIAEYGRFFSCLKCGRTFIVLESEASQEEIFTFQDAKNGVTK